MEDEIGLRLMGNEGQGMESKLIWELLPDEFPYEDKGCELFPSCLNCPFPDCLEEEPWGKERLLKRRRAKRMLELKREGKSVKEIARIFEVSTRTVRRWLKMVTGGESEVETDN
jgi:hypothetical protein